MQVSPSARDGHGLVRPEQEGHMGWRGHRHLAFEAGDGRAAVGSATAWN